MKNIFVGNLDFKTAEEDLRQLFGQYGTVSRVSIMTERDTGRSRGFGFVEMSNTEEGEKAILSLNGTQLGGRAINVNEARPKTERSGRGSGFGKGSRGRERRW
jgi:cold-inducible RNA-binding protein